MIRWQVTRCAAGTGRAEDVEKMVRLIADGWEPFAVTPSNACYIYHFRKRSDWAGPMPFEELSDIDD